MNRIPSLGALDTARPSRLVAHRLRAAVLEGVLPVGQALPPEPEFAKQLGVSQHRLREAIRILETEGLVEVRPGRNGGIFPTVPSEHTLARAFASLLCYHKAPLSDVLTARARIEPLCMEMAVRNATDEDIHNLWNLIHEAEQALAENRLPPDANAHFHVALGKASHNLTFQFLMALFQTLIGAIDASLRMVTPEQAVEFRRGSIRAHRALVHAIEARDPVAGRQLMQAHILGFREELIRAGIDVERTTVLDVS